MADVGVIFGGPSPEHDVSILTGLQAARALLQGSRHTVHGLFWSKAGEWFEVDPSLEASSFLDGPPKNAARLQFVLGPEGGFVGVGRMGRSKSLDLQAVLVCCHGGPGEDGSLQAALDLAQVRQAGPSAAGAALGMDKLTFGALARDAGLAALPRTLLGAETIEVTFPGPYIVKPRFGGSSIGIEVVEDVDTARSLGRSSEHLANGAVIEPYRPELYDLQVAVRSWPEFQISAIERPLRGANRGSARKPEILGYMDKYAGGEGMVSAPRELPAQIPAGLEERIHTWATRLAALCDLRGVARIDFLSDGDGLWVNEINTIPGSLARYLWIHPPLTFEHLLEDLLAEAMHGLHRSMPVSGADGSILQGASSIAAKLA